MLLLNLLARLLALLLALLSPAVTLDSLTQIDEYPLYTMHYIGDMDHNVQIAEMLAPYANSTAAATTPAAPAWGCSLFVAFAGPDGALYGRNFDWTYSPAVLLTYNPPDGYASVSMVDIGYLGYLTNARDLLDLPLVERAPLLQTPGLPFDGMNEHGLVIGMAAVPTTTMPYNPDLPTVGSLGIMREVLDHARTVDEALDLFAAYNIEMAGGPTVHYLIADAHGDSALVEFIGGELVVTHGTQSWDAATNFVRSGIPEPKNSCWRYRVISTALETQSGSLTPQAALDLLADAAQPRTQWSVVYEMQTGTVHVAMGGEYDTVYTLPAPRAGP